MKVVVVANVDEFLSKFKSEFLDELIQRNHHLEIVADFNDVRDSFGHLNVKKHNVKIKSRSINPFQLLMVFLKYRNIISQVKPDVVVSFTVKPNVLMGIISRVYGIRQIQVITGLGSGFHNSAIIRQLLIFMYKISNHKNQIRLFENKSIAQTFVSNKIYSSNSKTINGSGVNLHKFIPLPMPSNETLTFCFIGRVMKEKGIYDLLDASQNLYENGYKFKLFIVGDHVGFDSKPFESLPYLEFTKYIDDVTQILKLSDCLIHPSHHEGMANVILEASASNRPVIASNIPGCMEAVVDRKSGFLFESMNLADLTSKMITFIQLTSKERDRMGIHAREHMQSHFGRDKINKIFIDLIESR